MKAADLVGDLKSSQEFFERGRCLEEQDSGFRPAEGMYSAAQHVAHVAQTIEWFVEGASRREGFDLDFEKHLKQLECVTSLSATRTMLSDWYAAAVKYFGGQSEQELDRPLPEGPVMGGMSIWQVVGAIAEHTVHHRGALTVYSRLLGKVPPMPYGEM